MDKKTFAQFLLAATVVLVSWWVAGIVIYGPRDRLAEQQPIPQPPAAELIEVAVPAGPGQQQIVAPPAAPAPPANVREDIVLENDVIRTHWTNVGAALQKLEIVDERYRAPYMEGDERPVLTLLRDFQDGYYSDTIQSLTIVSPSDLTGTTRAIELSTSDVPYSVKEEPGALVFEAAVDDSEGRALRIRKTVTLEPGAWHYTVRLDFENVSDEPFEFSFALRGAAGIERETLQSRYLGTRVGSHERGNSYDITKLAASKVAKGVEPNQSANIAWAAVVNHYFAAIVLPEQEGWIAQVESHSVRDDDLLHARGRWPVGSIRKESQRFALASQNSTVIMRSVAEPIEAGASLSRSFRFIATPKDDNMLKAYGSGLKSLIEYGVLPSVSRFVLVLLNGIYALIPNYGVAILILTVLVRCALHPLTRKSQLSMHRMQQLQPQLTELQKKYANDSQKLAQEQMALYKRYGVSPLSGCGPMFLQLPVLLALFGALRAAIELRHAGFLWVDDLSGPDTLFRLPTHLPIVGNQFNLLPILMAAAMMVNQQFTKTPAATEQARQQQRMMKWFPLLFVVMLYNMPSGLCLYWTASTVLGLAERWLIERKASKVELRPVADQQKRQQRGKPPKEPRAKPSGLLGKIMRLAEEQPQADRSSKKRKKR